MSEESKESCYHEEVNIDTLWWKSDREVEVILKCENCRIKLRGTCKC